MSVIREHWIKCDECGEMQYPSHSMKEARSTAKRNGWTVSFGSGSKGADFCPQCTERLNKEILAENGDNRHET
jgi:hypothetical protein